MSAVCDYTKILEQLTKLNKKLYPLYIAEIKKEEEEKQALKSKPDDYELKPPEQSSLAERLSKLKTKINSS